MVSNEEQCSLTAAPEIADMQCYLFAHLLLPRASARCALDLDCDARRQMQTTGERPPLTPQSQGGGRQPHRAAKIHTRWYSRGTTRKAGESREPDTGREKGTGVVCALAVTGAAGPV
eukprot:3121315-Pyramimonas_sp.AAC.1